LSVPDYFSRWAEFFIQFSLSAVSGEPDVAEKRSKSLLMSQSGPRIRWLKSARIATVSNQFCATSWTLTCRTAAFARMNPGRRLVRISLWNPGWRNCFWFRRLSILASGWFSYTASMVTPEIP